MVVVDTLASFVNLQDANDYSAVGSVMSSVRQLARLPKQTTRKGD